MGGSLSECYYSIQIIAQSLLNLNLSHKFVAHPRENVRLQFRSEYFNLFNRVNLGPPVMDVRNPNFGKIFNTFADPRILQFGLKLMF